MLVGRLVAVWVCFCFVGVYGCGDCLLFGWVWLICGGLAHVVGF